MKTNFTLPIKTVLLICFILVFTQGFSQTSIWTNPITGTNPGASNPYTTGDTKNTNITVSGIGRTGVTNQTLANGYNADAWGTGATINTGKYYSFTVTPATGYKVSMSSFVYTGTRETGGGSNSGPTSFALRSDANADNYATNIGTPTAAGTTISLSGSAYQDLSTATGFRYYCWNAGGNGEYSINDFTFNGTVLGSATTSLNFGATNPYGSAPVQSFQINGDGLSPTNATITITGSTNYEVSTTSSTSGFGATATLTAASGSLSAANVWVRLKATSAVGTYNQNITFAGGGVTGLTIACSGTVTTRALTITANSGTKVYGTTQSSPVSGSAAFGSSGLQNGETIGSVTLTYGAGALTPTASVGATSTITPSAATGGTFTASNYSITYTPNSGTLTVTAAPLTITANNGTKTYGQTYTVGAGSTAFSSSGLQNSETIGTITIASTGAVNTASVGSYTIVPTAATGGTFTASNYSITYTNGTLTVNTAPLTITANNGSKNYGQTYTVGAGSTAFSSSGLQNSETIGTITIASTGAVNTASVGSYTIVPTAATGGTFTAANYSITYTNGTLTVNTAPLTITANNGSKTYGQTYTVGSGSTAFSSSGLQNSETIGTITIASTGAVNTASVGSYTIVPTAATGGTFTASNYSITYTNGTLTVNAASLTITANSGTKVYGTTQSSPVSGATTFGSTGLQNGETIGSVTLTYGAGALTAAAAVGSTSTITPSAATGGTFTASNYNITYTSNSGTLTVITTPLTITADNASKCYGTTYTLGTSAFTTVGLVLGETVGSVTLSSSGASSGAAVGSYSIVPSAATGGTFTASNYAITYVNGNLTVNALPTAPSGTDGSRCSTGTVNLSASVAGGETVDWYDAASAGTLLSGSSTSYTTPSISSTTVYYAEARNTTTGCVSATRTAVTATVYPTSVGGSVSGGTAICSGSTSGLLTLTGNTGSVVRWEYAVSPFSSWTTIATTATTYTSGALTQTTKFRAVVQSGSCSEATSSDTTVTVDPTTVGGTVASNQTICYGTEPGNLTLSGHTGAVIKWQSSSDAGFTSPVDITETSTTLAGSTIGSLTTNTYFRAVVQSGVCSVAYSASVLITIDALTVGGTVSANQTICSGSQPADLTLSGHTGSVIKWEASLDAGFTSPSDILVTSSTLTGATIGALTQDTYFRAVVQNGSCDVQESAYVLITVNDASVGGTVTGGTAICSGATSGLLTLSGYTGAIVRWEYSVSPFTSWTTIANTTNTYTSGALTQTTQFRAVVQSGVCAVDYATPTSVDITVTTWTSGAWDNGAPTSTTDAVISSTYTSAGANIDACSLTVNSSATVVISSGDTVSLSGPLTVASGSFVTFNNNANLIQTGTTNSNSGAIIMKRNSSALKRLDYTLWSSPVTGSQTLLGFSPLTSNVSPTNIRFYTYNTFTNLYDIAPPATTTFATAKGYLIRMPNNTSATTPTIWTGQFSGVPNNGNYSYTLDYGGGGQEFNLVGNPYPSPLDAVAFVSDANNSTSITGTLYFWRKTNNTLSPSYCTWTMGGFVTNGEAQVFDPNDVIQTGQGFFVEATGIGTTVDFKNAMRVNDHADQFFKSSKTMERNRIWLNATSGSGSFSQTMVGYITDATQGVDPTIDGKFINDGDIALTSMIGTTRYAIQGRALPFDAGDIVPLNFKAVNAGDYTIAIDHVDGLFTGSQDIYLRDNVTGTIHDLHTGGYTFTSTAGTFDSRFEVLYQLPLGYHIPEFNENQVIIYKNTSNEIVINAGNVVMSTVKVFDIRGRLLLDQRNINAKQTAVNTGSANEVLLVQITSQEGITVTKKVIR